MHFNFSKVVLQFLSLDIQFETNDHSLLEDNFITEKKSTTNGSSYSRLNDLRIVQHSSNHFLLVLYKLC
jgi:hypothetical protein